MPFVFSSTRSAPQSPRFFLPMSLFDFWDCSIFHRPWVDWSIREFIFDVLECSLNLHPSIAVFPLLLFQTFQPQILSFTTLRSSPSDSVSSPHSFSISILDLVSSLSLHSALVSRKTLLFDIDLFFPKP